MGILYRILQQSGCNQTGRMCHVYHEYGTNLVGNLTHAGIIPLAAVSRTAADNHFRAMFKSQFLHLVVIHTAGFLVEVVTDGMVEDTGSIHSRTMGQMASVVQIQAHEGVTRLQACQKYRSIGLRSRVGLHIGVLGTEQFAYPFDGQALHFVHHLAASVVPLSRISLGVLVRQPRPHGFHHFVAHEILRCDEFDSFELPLVLFFNQIKYCCVCFHFY